MENDPSVKATPTQRESQKLKDASMNPFMKDTDPRNPYGPNYEELPIETQIFYQFNTMKKYVHFEETDTQKMLNYNFKFLFGVVASFAVGITSAYIFKNLVVKKLGFQRIFEYINDYPHLHTGLWGAGFTTYGYFSMSEQYINEVCKPYIDQYIDKAVNNGFEDYKVSEYKQFSFEEEIKKLRGK